MITPWGRTVELFYKLLSIYIRLNNPYGHKLFDDQHRVFHSESVIFLQIGFGVGYPVGAIYKERILIPARGEEKLDLPCVPISLETVSVGRPSIEITAEADCPILSHIGEHNRYLAGCLMNYVPV